MEPYVKSPALLTGDDLDGGARDMHSDGMHEIYSPNLRKRDPAYGRSRGG